jgi:hypothetical protein
VRARRNRHLRSSFTTDMRTLDRLCAGTLLVVAVVECWLVPRTYPGRLWIFGTGLALLFASMLNLLRIRNSYRVRGLRLSCIGANLMMLAWVISLICSIGIPRSMANPQVPLIAILLVFESLFSLRSQ